MKFHVTCAALILALASPVLAEEGGASRYVPGNAATLIDLPPTKAGWVFESIYLHYDGDASASGTFPNAGLLTAGLDATSDAFILGGLYTFETPVLESRYDQIEGDSGSGAKLGGFEGRDLGIGPAVGYILPVGENTLVAEARWLPELDTQRRLEGDFLWLKLVYQF